MATLSIKDNQRFEVVLIGDYFVGKTSLIRRFNEDEFLFDMSIADFTNVEYRYRVSDTLTKDLVLRFYDTGGMENGGNSLTTSLFRNKDGIILTWDISDADTYRHLDQWENMISYNYATDNMPAIIVIANKSDKSRNLDTYKKCVENYAKKRIDCFKTSAKSGENVKEALDKLVSLMVETSLLKQGVPVERKTGLVNLEASQVDHPSEGSRGSCC